MTITLFVNPNGFTTFIQVCEKLKNLNIENNYIFTPSDFSFQENFHSEYIQIQMEITEYFKFKYCYNKLKR